MRPERSSPSTILGQGGEIPLHFKYITQLGACRKAQWMAQNGPAEVTTNHIDGVSAVALLLEESLREPPDGRRF